MLKVINPEAVNVINRIRGEGDSPKELASDIRKLLELASDRGSKAPPSASRTINKK